MTLLKSRKIGIFSKGLTHGSGQKFQIFSQFVFLKNGQNILFDFFLKKKQPFPNYTNDIRRKSKIWHFSKGVNPWFRLKFSNFFQFLFFKIGLNILLDYLQERKQPFPVYKNDIRRKSKIWHFCKGVNPWFWSKFSNFLSVFFFFKIGLNILFDYLEETTQPFLDFENDIIKKSKIWGFLGGGFFHGFGQNF